MIETAIALLLAHVLADFILQTDAMVATKHRLLTLLLHVTILAAVTWAALGFPPALHLMLLVTATHLAFDFAKQRWAAARKKAGKPTGFAAFALDQTAHLAVIWLAATLWPGTWASGLWSGPAILSRLPEAMVLATGLVVTVWTGGFAVRELMSDVRLPLDPETDESLPKGGQLIGRLERLMILMLLLANQPDGIGLLIAAKSILRFNELARDASPSAGRRASEYVIIGTLASFAWAIAAAWATAAVLRILATGA